MSEISSGLVASIYLAFSDDGENIRFWTSNAFHAVEWAQENWETEAFVRLSDAEAIIATKDAEIEAARRTSEYWKAEHLAGNQQIEQQAERIKDLTDDRDTWKTRAEFSFTQRDKQSAALKLARDALENHQGNYVLSKKECQPINEALAAINEVLKGE